MSPLLQNAALRAAGIPLAYETIDVTPEELPILLPRLVDARAAGNVTIPHKLSVYRACAVVTEVAEKAGAVNTFWCEADGLHGDNTDVEGFAAAVRAFLGADPVGTRMVLLGAGGAAAAALVAAEQWRDAQVVILSRNHARAAALAARFPDFARAERTPGVATREATLIVNATPVGQHDDEFPLSLDQIGRETAVMDLVYRRGETPWVRAARERGNRAADGLAMLLEQGALAFRRWFGREPDRVAMRAALV